jgi:hypothetical protein
MMLVTVYQWDWLGMVPMETVRTAPTRMAQGIMTGIGFPGAGVIFKEGLTVRGLIEGRGFTISNMSDRLCAGWRTSWNSGCRPPAIEGRGRGRGRETETETEKEKDTPSPGLLPGEGWGGG